MDLFIEMRRGSSPPADRDDRYSRAFRAIAAGLSGACEENGHRPMPVFSKGHSLVWRLEGASSELTRSLQSITGVHRLTYEDPRTGRGVRRWLQVSVYVVPDVAESCPGSRVEALVESEESVRLSHSATGLIVEVNDPGLSLEQKRDCADCLLRAKLAHISDGLPRCGVAADWDFRARAGEGASGPRVRSSAQIDDGLRMLVVKHACSAHLPFGPGGRADPTDTGLAASLGTDAIYFLSVHDRYVQMILRGVKQWEFRENPRFGILPDREVKPGDIFFLVSTFADVALPPRIDCMCRVSSVLRGEELRHYFGNPDSGNWLQAGCRDGTDRDWEYFRTNILESYSTALGLEPLRVSPPIYSTVVQHRTKHVPWKGIGFTPADHLKRFSVDGEAVDQYFGRIASRLLSSAQGFKRGRGG